MSEPLEAAQRGQQEAARRRFDGQAARRQGNVEALGRSGGLAEVNAAEELARRLDRVSRYYAGQPLPTLTGQQPAAASAPERVVEAAIERTRIEAPAGVAGAAAELSARRTPGVEPRSEAAQAASDVRAGILLEKIINTADFVGVRYFEAGVAASRAVCRIAIRDGGGRDVGHGTGSMVSPRLLLTNHHVLPDAEVARSSVAEFNYQDGVDGKPLLVQQLPLDPETFFLNDKECDFALVAVAASEQDLAAYGVNRLIEAQGKAIIGDFVTIVQHPRGEKKQVALRDNRVVDELEFFLHYEADTEPGSSGSPVFNDQWEIVALHHASVPAGDRGTGTFLNEGIRASRILRFLAEAQFAPAERALIDQLRTPERIVAPAVPTPAAGPKPSGAEEIGLGGCVSVDQGEQALSWSIPLELTIQVRPSAAPRAGAVPPPVSNPPGDLEALIEPFRDEDFSQRRGYDADFLDIKVPMPAVGDESLVARLDDGSFVLPYEHFSIVVNKARRLALFTAANVDAAPGRKQPEPGRDYTRRGLTGLGPNDQEKWFTDPRVPAIHQLPDRFFTKDRASFDKGHIVRREDVAWGDSFDEVRRANGDTFHVTNCSPQVANFNRSNKKGVWGQLENLILTQAAAERYCVFAGPVFRTDDPIFRGVDEAGPLRVAIPRQFWKVVVSCGDKALQTFAFLLDQDLSSTDLEFAVDQEWRTRMLSVTGLERLVQAVSFPQEMHDSDQFGAPGGEAIRAQASIDTR